jgi:hypothetical protein
MWMLDIIGFLLSWKVDITKEFLLGGLASLGNCFGMERIRSMISNLIVRKRQRSTLRPGPDP